MCSSNIPSDISLHFANTCHKRGTSLAKQVFLIPSLLWVRCYAVLVSSWLLTFWNGLLVSPWRWNRHCITSKMNDDLNYITQQRSEMPQRFCDFKTLSTFSFSNILFMLRCRELDVSSLVQVWWKYAPDSSSVSNPVWFKSLLRDTHRIKYK